MGRKYRALTGASFGGLLQLSGPCTSGYDARDYGSGYTGEVGGIALAAYIFDVTIGALRDSLANAGTL